MFDTAEEGVEIPAEAQIDSIPSDHASPAQEEEDDFGDFGEFEDAEWESAEATQEEPSPSSQPGLPPPSIAPGGTSNGTPDLLHLDYDGFLKAATAALSAFAPGALAQTPNGGQVMTLAELEAKHTLLSNPQRKDIGNGQAAPGWSKSPAGARLLYRLNLGPAPAGEASYLSQTPVRRSASMASNASSSSSAAQQLPPITMAHMTRAPSSRLQPPPTKSTATQKPPQSVAAGAAVVQIESTQGALEGLSLDDDVNGNAKESMLPMVENNDDYRNPFQSPRPATSTAMASSPVVSPQEAATTSEVIPPTAAAVEFDPFAAPPSFDNAAVANSGLNMLIPTTTAPPPAAREVAPSPVKWDNPFETDLAIESGNANANADIELAIEQEHENGGEDATWEGHALRAAPAESPTIEDVELRSDTELPEATAAAAAVTVVDGETANLDKEGEKGEDREDDLDKVVDDSEPALSEEELEPGAEEELAVADSIEDLPEPEPVLEEKTNSSNGIAVKEREHDANNDAEVVAVAAEEASDLDVRIAEGEGAEHAEPTELSTQHAIPEDKETKDRPAIDDSPAFESEDFEWSEAAEAPESATEVPVSTTEAALPVPPKSSVKSSQPVAPNGWGNTDDDFDDFLEAGPGEIPDGQDGDMLKSPAAVAEELATQMPDLSFMLSDALIEPKAKR